MASSDTFALSALSRYLPDHLIGEMLTKRWIDNAIPFLALVHRGRGVRLASFPTSSPSSSLTDLGRQFAEFGLIVLGLTIVMMSGGIDLSVASVFTLAGLVLADRDQCRGIGRSR